MGSLQHQFERCHAQLDELFLQHQEALLQQNLDEALFLLEIYWSCHCMHSDFEDTELFPKYRDLLNPGRWDATLYIKEHQKINDLYATLNASIIALMGSELQGSALRRGIIQLFDREKSFKGLCEHHQEREEQSLLVELEGQADRAWLEKTVEKFSAGWDECFASSTKSVNFGDR